MKSAIVYKTPRENPYALMPSFSLRRIIQHFPSTSDPDKPLQFLFRKTGNICVYAISMPSGDVVAGHPPFFWVSRHVKFEECDLLSLHLMYFLYLPS
jgi:hypothetical protein